MFRRLRRKLGEILPDPLFAFLLVVYRIFNLRLEKILVFPLYGCWLAILRGGLKFFLPNPKVIWIINLCREYEHFLKVEKGDIVLDVGANLGGFTIPAAKKVGDEGCVIAIEPEPNNLTHLRASVAANHLQNVRFVEKAAFSVKKKMKLYLSNDLNIGSHSLLYKSGKESEEVYADTLDNIFYELGLTRVDFVKMDIEGAEIEALKGGENVISRARKLVIAAYHIRNGKKTSSYIGSFLKTRGFKVHIDSNDVVHAYKKGIQ